MYTNIFNILSYNNLRLNLLTKANNKYKNIIARIVALVNKL